MITLLYKLCRRRVDLNVFVLCSSLTRSNSGSLCSSLLKFVPRYRSCALVMVCEYMNVVAGVALFVVMSLVVVVASMLGVLKMSALFLLFFFFCSSKLSFASFFYDFNMIWVV